MSRPPPSSTLFPYTTLFRSQENEPLGTLVLEEIPPKPRGESKIEVSFRVDADGILHVRAADAETGIHQEAHLQVLDRKSTRLNSSHVEISYAVFCLKKKKKK